MSFNKSLVLGKVEDWAFLIVMLDFLYSKCRDIIIIVKLIKITNSSSKRQKIDIFSKQSGLSLYFKSKIYQIHTAYLTNFSLNLIKKQYF